MLNEGLTMLGTDEVMSPDKRWNGVFEESTLESVQLPSTLRRIEYAAFACTDLRSITLPDGLEYIGTWCF